MTFYSHARGIQAKLTNLCPEHMKRPGFRPAGRSDDGFRVYQLVRTEPLNFSSTNLFTSGER
jgi:hypothetical protein